MVRGWGGGGAHKNVIVTKHAGKTVKTRHLVRMITGRYPLIELFNECSMFMKGLGMEEAGTWWGKKERPGSPGGVLAGQRGESKLQGQLPLTSSI